MREIGIDVSICVIEQMRFMKNSDGKLPGIIFFCALTSPWL